MLTKTFQRYSSNVLIERGVVDYSDKDAQGAPTPVTSGVTATAQVFAPDRTTSLSSVISLTQEADQPQNYYRGVVPVLTGLESFDYVSILYIVDGGSTVAYSKRWLDAKLVDE